MLAKTKRVSTTVCCAAFADTTRAEFAVGTSAVVHGDTAVAVCEQPACRVHSERIGRGWPGAIWRTESCTVG
jgi:hypothetical protein